MKKGFAKIIFAMIALAFSVATLAAGNMPHLGSKAPFNVAVPNQDGRWHIGFDFLYLQPTNSDLDYAIKDDDGLLGTLDGDTEEIDMNHEFGFRIDAGYHFEGAGSDLTIAYERHHSSESDSTEHDNGLWPTLDHPAFTPLEGFTTNGCNGNGGCTLASRAKGKVDFDYDAFDVLVGQKVIGHKLYLHRFAGIRYASIDSDLDAEYEDIGEDCELIKVKHERSFRGIGPRLGMDAKYVLGNGFGIAAGIAGTLLIGKADLHMHEEIEGGYGGLDNEVDVEKDSYDHLVPELDGKLGIFFGNHFDNGVILSIEAGWRAMNYFNALDRFQFHGDHDIHAEVVDNSCMPLDQFVDVHYFNRGNMNHNVSDLGYNGPYLRLMVSA